MKKLLQKLRSHLRRYRLRYAAALLILVFFFAYFFNNIFIFIKPGEEGILWRRFAGGTQVDKPYKEGTQVIFPWDRMYIYNVRTQMIGDTLEVLTIDGLPITIDIAIRFYPNRAVLGLLHQEIGPNYAHVVLVPEIEHVVRSIIGEYRPEELYASQRLIVARMVQVAFDRTASRYITLDDLLIRRIVLPDTIRTAIERKLTAEQMVQEYDFRIEMEQKEAERKRIEAEGFDRYNTILKRNLSEDLLKWRGIQATLALAESQNAKVVVIGSGEDGLPIILGNQ